MSEFVPNGYFVDKAGTKVETYDASARSLAASNALEIAEDRKKIAKLTEEIDALKPITTKIATIAGAYDSSFALVGAKAGDGIHTELLKTATIHYARMAKDKDAGVIKAVYFDLSQNPVAQETIDGNAGDNLIPRRDYPYFCVSWYRKGIEITADEFLDLLDIGFKASETTSSNVTVNVNETKYAFPKWAGIHPWIKFDGVTIDDVEGSLGFTGWYERFHALIGTYSDLGLEEINMSTDYLAANTSDAIPEAISSLTNGGMYMWHLPAPSDDGSALASCHYTPKIFLISGVHGDEKNSVWCMWKLLDALCRNDAEYRAITMLRNFCDVYIVPLVNPYGLANNKRSNGNSIDLNRDFPVKNWAYDASDALYPTAPDSQYETRCLAWWIRKISPNVFVDFHRSEGNSERESGMFIQWGTSPYKSIASLIDENIMEVTPYVRKNLAPKFDAYHHRFGHSKVPSGTSGTSSLYAAELGIPAATYEVVRRVYWGGTDVLTTANTDEVCAMDYHGIVNFTVKLVQYAVETLNDGVDWAASIDW